MGVFGDHAEEYNQYNLSVIPCFGKKPIPKAWTDFCKKPISDELALSWIEKHGDATAIGLPMGPANKLIAFDFDYAWPDKKEAQDQLLAAGITFEIFEKERAEIEARIISMLPNSPCKKVGKPGKWTAFFRPNGIARTIRCTRRGVRVFDILYEGAQTILPPSIHPDTGKPYYWVDKDLISSLELLPELILEEFEQLTLELEAAALGENSKTIAGRNDLLKQSAWGMFSRGMTLETVVTHLLVIDSEKNSPPLFSDKTEFPRNYKRPEAAASSFAKSIYKSFKDTMKKEAIKKAESSKPEQIGFYFRYAVPREDGTGVKLVDVPQYKLMADFCFEQKNMCFDDSLSLRFDGKKWNWFSKNALANFIISANEKCIKPGHLDGFTKLIRGKCLASEIATKSFDGLINVNNGVIDVRGGILLPHSHEYLFKYCSPVDFSPGAVSSLWNKFLDDTFKGNKDLIKLAQLLFGYVLIGGRPFLHKAFVLCGSGRNGKSTFLNILRACLGTESYSTVSMSKLDKEFSVVSIDGKLANIVEEAPNDEINAEAFKNLVGGGEIQAAHKGFDEYKFRCNARFVFACNDMPIFKDKSVGLEERLVFIPFDRYLKEEERDTEMTEKLLAELPGIFNWAIEGAKEILADRKLPKYKVTDDAKDAYRKETDPLYAWFCDEVEVCANASEVTVRDAYDRYREECEDNGNRPYSKDKFSKRLRAILQAKCDELGIKFESKLKDATGNNRIFNVIRFRTPWTPRYKKVSDKKPSLFDKLDTSDTFDTTF